MQLHSSVVRKNYARGVLVPPLDFQRSRGKSMSDDLSEYERHRLEHIKRNHEMLVRLGLEKPLVEKKATPKGQKRVRAAPVMPETLRRSGRVRGAAVEYDKEVIDKHGDDMDKQCAAKPGRKRERKEDGEDNDDDEAARAEMLESTTAFLRAARAALLRFATSADGEAPTTDAAWREEALRRWGDLVGGGGGGETRDWEIYVTSRLSTPPPPSPLDLLQEYYAADQWQLLCCCVLMSRCSSWDTKHRCISGFFAAYPTPSAFLEKAGPCPSPSLSPSPNFCSCPCPCPCPYPCPCSCPCPTPSPSPASAPTKP